MWSGVFLMLLQDKSLLPENRNRLLLLLVKISKFIHITGIINGILKRSQVQKHTRLKIYKYFVITYFIARTRFREQDKSVKTTAEMKFVKRTAKYTWQDYRTNEDMLSELQINAVVKKIQSDRKKLTQPVRRMDRQTATLSCVISTV